MRLVDFQGNTIPFDVESYSQNISRALTLVFIAKDVPSLGYKTYYLEPAEPASSTPASTVKMDDDNDAKNPFRVPGEDVVENEFCRVTIDRVTGKIEVFDKLLNRTVSKDVEIVAQEQRGGDAISKFPDTGRTLPNLIKSVKLIRNGNVETTLEIAGEVGGEPIVQRLFLYRDLKRIELVNAVAWTPGRAMEIQQQFSTEMQGAQIRNGVPFGSVSEAEMMPHAGPHAGDEISADVWRKWRQIQDWISATSQEWSLTISADHQLFTVDGDAIRGDMIRGTTFNQLRTFEDGKAAPVKQPWSGTYTFRYAISSGKGDWIATKAWRQGMEFNAPLIAVVSEDELSPKSLPPEQSFLSVQGDSLVVSALKKADKGDGLVLRLFEEVGQRVDTPIRFAGREQSFERVNLLEEPSEPAAISTLHVMPYRIESIEWKLNSH